MPKGKKANQSLDDGEASAREQETAKRVDGGELVSRVLESQGVKYLFAINGGHTFPILATLREHGIKLIHMRHEQACAYAADAYARTSGAPGVCSVTAGCGLTNAVTGLCVAGLTGSAVVCIAGQHPTTEDQLGSFQEAYGSEICRTFSKFTKRVLDWSTIESRPASGVSRGHDAAAGTGAGRDPDQHPLRQPRCRASSGAARRSTRRTTCGRPGDPAKIERALELLQSAERPLIAAGDGIFWSGAAAELARVRRADEHPRLCAACRAGRAPRGSSAGDPRRVEEAVHRPRRRRAGDRLSILERRALRRAADLERQGATTSRSMRRRTASAGTCRRRSRSSAIRSSCCAS